MDDILELINNANENQRTAAIAVAYEYAADLPPLTFPDGTIEDVGGYVMRLIRTTLTN
jgi:hypothetical protein